MQVQIHLAIEKGRHQNIARQERVCNNCTMNVLETEYHYLLICPNFYNLRTKYIKKYYYKLTQLLSSQSNITVQIYRKLHSLPIKLEIKYLTPH